MTEAKEKPLYGLSDHSCQHDFIDWFPEPFRSEIDGRLKRFGWCPCCWEVGSIILTESSEGESR